jgi:hypothetical protein
MTRLASWFRRDGWQYIGLPLLVYALAALLITWPLAAYISTHAAGLGYGDSFEYVRLGWWAKYALQMRLNPFYQSLLGYPDGFFSAAQWAQPLIYWPVSLLGFVFNPVIAFNLWILLEIILSGLAAYWLCREVLGAGSDPSVRTSTLAALFGGLIFMAFPTVQGHLVAGHVNPLSNYALPVLALCLYRLVEGRGGTRTALVSALALWILALGNFTFPVFILLPLILFGGSYVLLFRRYYLLRMRLLRSLAIMFGVGVILILPFYLPLLADLTAPARPTYLQEVGWVRYSADLLAFVAPSPFNPWTAPIAPAYSRAVLGTNSTEGAAYLGIIAVALAVIAISRRQHRAGLWLVIALGCMVFSLGPLLKWQDQPVTYTIGEYQSHVVLPWALFQNLPLINATRTPGRFNITTGLALGVLAALGLNVLLPRLKSDARRLGLTAALAVAVMAEYQLFFPFPVTSGALPSYFDTLATRGDVRAVLDVPWDDPIAQKAAMYQQVTHHKPLIAGYVSRLTPVDPAKLSILSDTALGRVSSVPDEARSILNDSGVDVLVYHWQLLDRDAVSRWATGAFGSPAYQDDQLAIFEVPKGGKRAETVQVSPSSAGWWIDSGRQWMSGDSGLYVYAPSAIDQQWTLSLSPLLHSRRIQLVVDGRLARAWLVNTPTAQVDFWLRLDPGFHTLRFVLPDGCTPSPVNPVCLLYNVDPSARSEQACTLKEQNVCVGALLNKVSWQDTGVMAFRPQAIRLASGMTLQGFRAPDRVRAGQALTVETDWQAAQKLPGDYHLFVHMLDRAGKLVAQADTVPGDGTFATPGWSVPQDWIEAVNLPLPAGLALGSYSLYTGWYSYPDLTRLAVEGSGPRAADGLVYLLDVEVQP